MMSLSQSLLLIFDPTGCSPFATAWSRFCWFVAHSRLHGRLSALIPFLWFTCGSPLGFGKKAQAINLWAKYVFPSILTLAYPLLLNFVPQRIFSPRCLTSGFPRKVVLYGDESLRIRPESLASYISGRLGIFFQIVFSMANYTKAEDIFKQFLRRTK